MDETAAIPLERQCLDCGAVLPAACSGSICMRCLWLGNGDSAPATEPGDTRHPAPQAKGAASLRVPGHEIIEEIARGGMGIVYRAWERGPDRGVALKMLRPQLGDDPDMRARFRQEARALAALNHPAILPVFRVDENEDLPFFTMKLADGGTLASRRADYDGQWRKIAELLVTLASAVHFAHSHGVLHRDIKPANILFDGSGQAFLSDFGLVKILDDASELTLTEHFMGTPLYSSPEVAAANASRATVASDVWSLGAVLYELLAGRTPFEAEGVAALLRRIVESPLPPFSAAVPRDLAVICRHCLQKEPSARYQSAGELEADLTRWLEHRPILARPVSQLGQAMSWMRRNPTLSVLGGALAASIVLLVGGLGREAKANRDLAAESAGRQLEAEARERVSREGAEASRRAEGQALAAEIRVRIANGPWHERDALMDTVRRSAALADSPEGRGLLVGLSALPSFTVEHSVPFDPGGWAPLMDADYRRYISMEKARCVIREVGTRRELHAIPDLPRNGMPPGPLSPDGRFALITGKKGSQLWDLESGKVLLQLPMLFVWNFFSRDGRWLVCQRVSGAKRTVVCDLAANPPVLRPVEQLPDFWGGKVISPDGRFFLAVPENATFGLKLVETATGNVLRDYQLSSNAYIHAAAFSPDSSMIYAGMIDGRVAAWARNDPRPVWAVSAHSGACDGLAVFDEGRCVMSRGRDARTRVWDGASGRQLAVMEWSGHRVSAIGPRLLIQRDDERRCDIVRFEPSPVSVVRPVAIGQALNTYQRGDACVLPWPDSSAFCVSGGHDIQTFTAEGGGPGLHVKCGRVEAMALDFNNKLVLRASSGGIYATPLPGALVDRVAPTVGLSVDWNNAAFRIARPFAASMPAVTLTLEPGSRQLLVGGGMLPASGPAMVNLTRAVGGVWQESPLPPNFLEDFVTASCVFSRDGTHLAWTGTLKHNGKPLRQLRVSRVAGPPMLLMWNVNDTITGMAFSPDNRTVYLISAQKLSRFDYRTGKAVWKRDQRIKGVTPWLSLSGDGKVLAVTGPGDTVQLIDPETGLTQVELRHPDGGQPRALALTPDGIRLAVLAEQQLQIWRLDRLPLMAPPVPPVGAAAGR